MITTGFLCNTKTTHVSYMQYGHKRNLLALVGNQFCRYWIVQMGDIKKIMEISKVKMLFTMQSGYNGQGWQLLKQWTCLKR